MNDEQKSSIITGFLQREFFSLSGGEITKFWVNFKVLRNCRKYTFWAGVGSNYDLIQIVLEVLHNMSDSESAQGWTEQEKKI